MSARLVRIDLWADHRQPYFWRRASNPVGVQAMGEEHLKGGLEKAAGRIKEAAGALTGNERLKSSGQLDQVKGGARQAWGDVKDAAKDLAAGVRHATNESETAIDREVAAERDRP